MKTMMRKKKKKMMKKKRMKVLLNESIIKLKTKTFSFIDNDNAADLGKILDMSSDPGSSSGCTAVVTLLHDKQLFVANAGDSRCVVCRDGRAIEMSIG